MASIVIEAEPRSSFGKGPNRRLRAQGKIPAVLYGGDTQATPITVDPKEIAGIIRSHGGVNTIFELAVRGSKSKENVMIREYQIEPVEHRLLHADLVRVAMDRELTLDVTVELTGTAVGVKMQGGMLDFVARSVELACLPANIPETIVADVSHLELGHYLRAGDLTLPEGVRLVSEASLVIAHVIEPRVEVPEVAEEAVAEGEEAPADAEGAEEGEKAESTEEEEGKE